MNVLLNPTRNRNHRKKNCSSCETITIAYSIKTLPYIDDEEKFKKAETHPNLQFSDTFTNIDNNKTKTVFCFSDGSLLAFDKTNGCHTVDTFLRKNEKRLKK